MFFNLVRSAPLSIKVFINAFFSERLLSLKNRIRLRHLNNNLENSLNVLKFEGVREIQSGKNHQCPTNPFGQNGIKVLQIE